MPIMLCGRAILLQICASFVGCLGWGLHFLCVRNGWLLDICCKGSAYSQLKWFEGDHIFIFEFWLPLAVCIWVLCELWILFLNEDSFVVFYIFVEYA